MPLRTGHADARVGAIDLDSRVPAGFLLGSPVPGLFVSAELRKDLPHVLSDRFADVVRHLSFNLRG
jgi:hypothetical protein